jgi:hypothetical protein
MHNNITSIEHLYYESSYWIHQGNKAGNIGKTDDSGQEKQ